MMNKKGQLSMDNVLQWVILVIFFGVVSVIARGFINQQIAQTNNTLEIIALNAILPIAWFLIIGVLVTYARPSPPSY